MEKGINFDAIKEMTVGELQKLEADYPTLFDLSDYVKSKKLDTSRNISGQCSSCKKFSLALEKYEGRFVCVCCNINLSNAQKIGVIYFNTKMSAQDLVDSV